MNKIILAIALIFSLFQSDVIGQVCPVSPGTEKITNGSFELGRDGSFDTDFTEQTESPPTIAPSEWSVWNNPNATNSFFANMQDHTPGAGTQMLIVDANNTVGSDVYSTTVSGILPNTTYFFSAWFANINTNTSCATCQGLYFENSPILKFSINNVQVGATVKVDSASHGWSQFFVEWNSGPSPPANLDLRIENLQLGNGNGNDLALDDISFSTSCDKITDLAMLGQSSVLPDELSTCNVAFPYELDPALPGTYAHTWKTSASTTVGSATTYDVPPTPSAGDKVYLCYTHIPGCPRVDSVVFISDPINVDLGSDVTMCAPIIHTIESGVSVPPANIKWYRNTVLIPSATTSSYTATETGTYRVEVDRPGCGNDADEMVISSPVSTLSGTGTYCTTTSPTQAEFTITGSTKVKWYKNLTDPEINALNPSDELPTISLSPHTLANTGIPGCPVGIYAEDISSYPGSLRPGTTAHTTSCPAGSVTQFSGVASTFVEINQPLTLTSVDFQVLSGWSTPSTYTFSIRSNNPTGGPYCGSCTPPGNYNGPGALAFPSTTSASISTAVSHVETLPVNYVLPPGKYWFEVTSSGGAFGIFDCTPTNAAGTDLWATPVTDNTGNNAIRQLSALKGGNPGSAGGLFNMQFQVGSNNACDRLFICATESCPAPVEFLSFDVKKYSQSNYLIWKTASEDNSAHFVVERSVDGVNYEALIQIQAAGSSSDVLSYSYTDHHLTSASVIYYRIKEVDRDGSIMYSEIKSIRNEDQTVAIYPVPVKQGQSLNVEFRNETEEKVVVEICNNLGQSLFSTEHQVRSGLNTLEVNINQVLPGSYYVRVTGNGVKIAKFLVE